MTFTDKQNAFLVNIPTLSDLCFNEKKKFPGAIIMDLSLNKEKHIREGNFECLLINDHIYTISENHFQFHFPCEKVREELLKIPPKQKKQTINSNMSQTEKFNTRYNQ